MILELLDVAKNKRKLFYVLIEAVHILPLRHMYHTYHTKTNPNLEKDSEYLT